MNRPAPAPSPRSSEPGSRCLELIASLARQDLSSSETLEWMLAELQTIFRSQAAALYLLNHDDHMLALWDGRAKKMHWNYQVHLDSGPVVDSLSQRHSIWLAYCDRDSQSLWKDVSPSFKVTSAFIAPLVIDEERQPHSTGALLLLNGRTGELDEADQSAVEQFAAVAAGLIHNASLLQRLQVANADLELSRWQLINSRNTLRTLFDSLPISMYIVDSGYRIVSVNQHRAQRAGVPPQELVGKKCYEAFFGRQSPCPGCKVHETFLNKQPTHRLWKQWDQERAPLEWEIDSYPIMTDQQVNQVIVIEQDVTEKRRLEASLIQSEKLAAVGQLAAGIAHEINNPLTAILANAQMLAREIDPDDDRQELVEMIHMAGAQAAQVVRNLLDLARKEQYRFEYTDINRTIQSALQLLHHEIVARDIDLVLELDPELPKAPCSPDHLQGVWINLVSNAIDAIDAAPDGPRQVRIKSGRQGDEIFVSVSDTGEGIPQHRLNRIFEPFYTSKAVGRGTGLGLSVCHRIIKQHEGRLLVDSTEGMGATFTAWLPLN